MANYMIKGETLTNIANAIRAKSGSSVTMTPEQMSTEIENISVGGGDIDAFIDGSLTEITSNATYIREKAFYYHTTLTSVNLPLATNTGTDVFAYCAALTSVNLPLATNINSKVFSNCTTLTSVNLPLVRTIQANAFYSCKELTSINFPKLSGTGNSVFYNCSKLEKVLFNNADGIGAISIGTGIFKNTPIESGTGYVYVHYSRVETHRAATNWVTYASQIFPWVATVEELANIDSTTYTRACVGTENNGTEYTYNGTSWEVIA